MSLLTRCLRVLKQASNTPKNSKTQKLSQPETFFSLCVYTLILPPFPHPPTSPRLSHLLDSQL